MSKFNSDPVGPIVSLVVSYDGKFVYRFEGRDDGRVLEKLSDQEKALMIFEDRADELREGNETLRSCFVGGFKVKMYGGDMRISLPSLILAFGTCAGSCRYTA